MKTFSRSLAFFILLSLIISNVTATDPEPQKSDLTAEMVSLKITKGKRPFDKTKKYEVEKGQDTELKALITSPDKKILKFQAQDSKLLLLEDNLGNSLLKGADKYKVAKFWPFTESFYNKQQCIVIVNAPCIPASKADSIHLKADLLFLCTSGKTVTEEKKITPAQGGSFTFGDTTVEVSDEMRKPYGISEEAFKKKGRVLLGSESVFHNIASIAFLDAEGKEIKHKKIVDSVSNFMGKQQSKHGYQLDKLLESYTIKITYYPDAEVVTLPIDLKVGLGME